MVFRLWTVYPAWRSFCVRLQSSHMQPCNCTATQASICIKEFFEESAGRSALFEVVAALSRLTVKLRRRMEVFEERARVRAVGRGYVAAGAGGRASAGSDAFLAARTAYQKLEPPTAS